MPLHGEIRREDMLWLLGSLFGVFRIPFDAALIAQCYPPPYPLTALHDAAHALGIKTGNRPQNGIDWIKLPLPAIVFDGTAGVTVNDNEIAVDVDSLGALLIVKTSAEQLFYFSPASQTQQTRS